jgi:hypothetical protein
MQDAPNSIEYYIRNIYYNLNIFIGYWRESKRGRDKQLSMRKATGNSKKRSRVNILLNHVNVVGIDTATARHSHC